MVAPAITLVELLRNTVNDVGTATAFDITTEFLASVTPTTGTGTITYTGANVTRTGLSPGTTYYYWLSITDQAGLNTVQALGSITTATPAPSPDITAAVDFGASDYLSNAGSGRYDSKTGTISVWLNIDSANTAVNGTIWMNYTAVTGKYIYFELQGGNYIRVFASTAAVNKLNFRSNVVPVNQWIHVMVAWDNATSVAQVFVNDESARHSVTTQVNDFLGWDEASYTVGNRVGGATQYQGCMAELYATREYIDISLESNRRKFISASGAPVSLGTDGSTPTGNQPDIYLSGAVANWNAGKNFGSSSDFATITGAVTACASSPQVALPAVDITKAVDFDGTTDYLVGTGTSTVSSKTGVISVWFKQDDTSNDRIMNMRNGTITMLLDSISSSIRCYFSNSSGAAVIELYAAFTSGVWNHVMFSWDTATSAAHGYVNDSNVLSTTTMVADGLCYWSEIDLDICADTREVPAALRWNGCIAELYATNEYVDLSVEANRRKFISASGAPVSLGADGSTPTGTQPLIYASGAASNWNAGKNFGSWSNFTVFGTLTDCASRPGIVSALSATITSDVAPSAGSLSTILLNDGVSVDWTGGGTYVVTLTFASPVYIDYYDVRITFSDTAVIKMFDAGDVELYSLSGPASPMLGTPSAGVANVSYITAAVTNASGTSFFYRLIPFGF